MKKLTALIFFIIIGYNNISAQNNDIISFTSGKTKVFNSKHHTKAQGLSFDIEYLDYWKKEEGNRPHIVQKFNKTIGTARVEYAVLVFKLDKIYTENEIKNEFENLQYSLPKNATYLYQNTDFRIDGEMAAFLDYKIDRKTSIEIELSIYTRDYMIFYNDYYILIQCSVGDIKGKGDLKQLFNSYKPFFTLVANSFILQTKWEN
jgi:hypothetical protein